MSSAAKGEAGWFAIDARWQDWAERLDVAGVEWTFGRAATCDVRVQHPSVAPVHAQVILRRGRVIVRPLGVASVLVDGAPIRAPVVVNAQVGFQIGEVLVSVSAGRGPRRAEVSRVLGEVQREWYSPVGRRFELAQGGEGAWSASAPSGSAAALAGGWAWAFARPSGVRLESLLYRLDRGGLGLPGEVAVVVAAQLGDALCARHRAGGPHGSVGPAAVHLGTQGEVTLIDPMPEAPPDEACAAPERRFGAPPSRPADAFAYASLCVRLIRVCGAPPEAWAPLTPLLQSDPHRRSVDVAGAAEALRRRAEAGGLDATARHVAAPVRLLVGARAIPLLAPGPNPDA